MLTVEPLAKEQIATDKEEGIYIERLEQYAVRHTSKTIIRLGMEINTQIMQITFALSIQDKSFAITCIFDLYYIAKPADAGFGLSTPLFADITRNK